MSRLRLLKTRPPKLSDVPERVRDCIETGRYRLTYHYDVERRRQRNIPWPEARHVLLHGHRIKAKDTFKPAYQSWTYAFGGKSTDDRNLRIAVAFDAESMLVVTAIDLDAKEEDQ